MKKLAALIISFALCVSAHAAIMMGPMTSGTGGGPPPPSGVAPVVASNSCNSDLPITNGVNVPLFGGGSCTFTTTCAGIACTGTNTITSWAITAQSTANAFSITSAGILQGGSAASSITTGTYTVTVTATNSTGTSPGVLQTVNINSVILQVATNSVIPASQFTTITQGMCRTAHYTRAGINTSSAIYAGWFITPISNGNFGIEQPTGNYTVSRWVEYPNGTYTQVDNNLTVVSGTNTIGSPSGVVIPAGTLFYEWYHFNGTFPYQTPGTTMLSSALGEACNTGTSGVPTSPGAITDNHSFDFVAASVAIVGPSAAKAVLLVGDSRTLGVHDTADTSTDRGNLARAVGPTYDYMNTGISGYDPSEYLTGAVNVLALKKYATHVVNELGFNLFYNRNMANVAAWPYEARMQALFLGLGYVGTNLEPHTSSTNSWSNAAGQTILTTQQESWDTNREAQSPFIDLLTPTQDATTPNIWMTNGTAEFYVADGIHETRNGNLLIGATSTAVIAAINAAATSSATMPSVSLTPSSPAYSTVAPKFGSAALSGGSGTNALAGTWPGTIPVTMECWFKGTGTGTLLAGASSGSVNSPTIAVISGGFVQYREYNGGSFITTSKNVADGNWHHIALVMVPGAVGTNQIIHTIYVDGVSFGSTTQNSPAPSAVGGAVVSASTNQEVDEVAIWNYAKYTANFTPPAEAYNGNEAGLVQLFHLDSNLTGYSPWWGLNAPGTPIVDKDNCNFNLPVTSGETVCTFTANNSPTSWSLSSTSPTCTSCFAISSSGVVTASTGFASITATTYTLTVTATNAAGTSSGQAQTVIASTVTSCLKGSAYPDGCPGAPAGTGQYSTALNGYGTRPPWNVAGVDYAVGPRIATTSPFSSGTTLKTALVNQGASYSAGVISFSGSSCNSATVSGYNFGGTQISITGCSNFTLTDCNMQTNTANAVLIGVDSTTTNFTLQYCTLNGNKEGGGATDTLGTLTSNSVGTILLQYNLIENCWAECIVYNQETSGAPTTNLTMQFNVIDSAGWGGPPTSEMIHGDWIQIYNTGGILTTATFAYNLWRQVDVSGDGMDASQGISLSSANQPQTKTTNGVVNNNTFIALNSNSTTAFVLIDDSNITGHVNVINNYADPTGIYVTNWLDYYPQPNSGTPANPGAYEGSGNIYMTTGGTIPPP